MLNDGLRKLLREAEGKSFRFIFADGDEMLAQVICATHVDADDTVVLLRVGASPEECAWQVQLADILSVSAPGAGCVRSE
jgi:hypothetical protein